MRVPLALCFLLLAAGCGQEAPQEPAPSRKVVRREPAPPAPAPATAEQQAARASGKNAAAVLRLYYDHLEAGRLDAAWAMRGGKAAGRDAFARTFGGYERYRVTVGEPSAPVAAGGWSFVEVPIQIFGKHKGGEPFGSAGSVTLRRAAGAPGATAAQGDWHIYTGE